MSTGKDLPAETFDAESVHMTFAAKVVAALADKTDKVLLVNPEKLLPLPGFNVRVKNDAYNERVEGIAASIEANGYYHHKPLGGLLLDSDHDHLFIHDGEHRLDALALLQSRGVEIKAVPVAVAPQGTTVEDLTVSLVQSNTGEPLSPVEMGAVIKRLMSFGMDKDEVSRRIGKTVRHIDNLLVLAGAPVGVRTAVADGKIAAAEAVKLVRKDPKTAATKVAEAVKKAEAAGKAKATPKTMKGEAGPKLRRERIEVSLATGDRMGDALKALAKHARQYVAHKTDDSDELQEDGKLILIVETLDRRPPPTPKAKKASKPKAAPATAAAEDADAAFDAAPDAKAVTAKKPAGKKATGKAAQKPASASKGTKGAKSAPKAETASGEAPAAADGPLAHTGAVPVDADADEMAGL